MALSNQCPASHRVWDYLFDISLSLVLTPIHGDAHGVNGGKLILRKKSMDNMWPIFCCALWLLTDRWATTGQLREVGVGDLQWLTLLKDWPSVFENVNKTKKCCSRHIFPLYETDVENNKNRVKHSIYSHFSIKYNDNKYSVQSSCNLDLNWVQNTSAIWLQ